MNANNWVSLVLICAALTSFSVHAGDYETVHIIVPKPGTAMHDNRGRLAVRVVVSPPLQVEAGDRLTLLLDGKAVA